MENIKQIKTIFDALSKEKEKWLFEFTKVSVAADKKRLLVEKMLSYQREYDKKDKLELSKSNPLLHKNFDLFYKKMLEALFKAENELEALNRSKATIITKVQQIDQKIKVMEIFQERVELNKKMANEQIEQTLMSDLTINKLFRGSHD
jgi:hypothetical protein